ncbi:NADPH-dependent enal/enone/nitroreductase, Oye family [Citrifermentans bemidjiense Bem]|uniref:NADPH-dependent enal/enone/nitroreductase, Oye family n=1 Tax=Citrifermentans bemidjiense (strain ATCC BAA-1014 / DSM 16622 / JCM 12645 / Bem) TaxID=404380 RepID=B5EDF1_CITBB|nr:NADH:flavin oxidoreductase/NADH oxidase [Citrifermentans bemidjiense]ACH39147.1 NADPH-dependent enal/enone/nitroreductase, Oye family [Citrifermentans bemidjiense Bem]
MSMLFTPLQLRELTFKNRIFVSPMCQYSSKDGMPTDWHLVHLGSRAVGGAGLVMVEATAVSQQGRISPDDSGIWSADHARAFAPIARFIKEQGAVPGIQLAHAGRKASTDLPWKGSGPVDANHRGWQTIAPSPVPFAGNFPSPREATVQDLEIILGQFASAARRSAEAGFEVVEIHMAHGYLLHEFLSPLANLRADDFGGSLENRCRFPLRVAKAVREIWPEHLPVFVRVSASDWMEGGWDLEQTVELVRRLKAIGVDLIDCSSGGLVPEAAPPFGPGFQTPFATEIRKQAGIATGAVGFITAPAQAEHIVATGLADAVFLAREMLRDPYWPLHAANALQVDPAWPSQYERAK